MKKTALILMIGLMALFFTSAGTYAEEMMRSQASGIANRASHFIGSNVTNTQNERLGKISDIVFNTYDRKITFAILSAGGMLGIGEKLIPVPMSALSFKEGGSAVLDITKDNLAKAPSFTKNTWPDMTSRQWTEDTYKFYGQRPYREEMKMEKDTDDEVIKEMEEMREKARKNKFYPSDSPEY